MRIESTKWGAFYAKCDWDMSCKWASRAYELPELAENAYEEHLREHETTYKVTVLVNGTRINAVKRALHQADFEPVIVELPKVSSERVVTE